jgi:hypothetical protein
VAEETEEMLMRTSQDEFGDNKKEESKENVI